MIKVSHQMKDVVNDFYKAAEQQSKLSKGSIKEGQRFFEIALDDIVAAKALLKAEMLPQSTYYLQQSMEKASKAFLLLSGVAKPRSFKAHDQAKISLENMFNNNWALTTKKLAESLTKTPLKVEKEMKQLKELDPERVRTMTQSEIYAHLDRLDKLEKKLLEKKVVSLILRRARSRQTIWLIRYLVKLLSDYNISWWKARSQIRARAVEHSISNMILNQRLVLLSFITMYHHQTCRYPYVNNSEQNYFLYKEDLGIVHSLPALIERAESVLSKFKEVNKETLELNLNNKARRKTEN